VINIDPNTTEHELLEAFKSNTDGVSKARILLDKDGVSKSSGFVEFASSEAAQKAINTCQNMELGNKRLIVQMARQ
jgi:RNA recognition motif-containing protein